MRRNREQGFVLVIVLGVLVLLTVLTLGFARRAQLERRTAVLTMEHTVALSLAEGAAQRGIADLRNRIALEELGQPVGHTAGPTWRTHITPFEENLYAPMDMDENDTVDYVIEDLDGRISLNQAPKELLEEIDFLNFATINRIIERREKEKIPFLVAEEVLTLDDFDDEAWYGKDGTPGLRDLFTAWGDAQVNVNTAPPEVLAVVPDLDRTALTAIVSYRNGDDGRSGTDDDRFFASFDDLALACNLSASQVEPLKRYCKLNSRFFTITGFATRMQGKVRAACTATVEVRGSNVEVLQWREEPVGT